MQEDKGRIMRSGPFKGMLIEPAPQTGVDMYRSLADDFMKRIMDYEPGETWITDESNLYDFAVDGDLTVLEMHNRIKNEYDVDVTDIEDGNLLEIFRRINRK